MCAIPLGRLARTLSRPSSRALQSGILVTALVVAAALAISTADAGTATSGFDAIWTTLSGWLQNGLGRLLSGTMLIVGIAIGVARQSIMSFVVASAAAFGLFAAPTLMNSIVSATVPAGTDGALLLARLAGA